LKKIAGVKHVIHTTLETDSIRNVCTGNGRIKLRLQAEEDPEMVKLNFLKAGYSVQEHTENIKKKSGFTQELNNADKPTPKGNIDAKQTKVAMLQTNNPEVFGNTGSALLRQGPGQNSGEVKIANAQENLAIASWSKMGKK
jgi:hypothetical protein